MYILNNNKCEFVILICLVLFFYLLLKKKIPPSLKYLVILNVNIIFQLESYQLLAD